jgi:Lon protease-like protein
MRIPLFPLRTVLFPGGVLPLKIFEQRYVDMAKACLAEAEPFGVCMILRGDEVARDRSSAPPEFAQLGTLARIGDWEMPQLGILHVSTVGGERFKVERHSVEPSGLVVGEVAPIPAEPKVALDDAQQPIARLLELIAARVGPRNFPVQTDYADASWISYRLAELLPLPLHIKQSMLEINDARIRLAVIAKFLAEQGVL